MGLSFFGEGILLLMGCSKNYINVLGFTNTVYHAVSNKCAQTLQDFFNFFVKMYNYLI